MYDSGKLVIILCKRFSTAKINKIIPLRLDLHNCLGGPKGKNKTFSFVLRYKDEPSWYKSVGTSLKRDGIGIFLNI